jgi:hypothetical protein
MQFYDEFGAYVDDAVAWYKRRSVWAAGGVGVAVGLVLSYIF